MGGAFPVLGIAIGAAAAGSLAYALINRKEGPSSLEESSREREITERLEKERNALLWSTPAASKLAAPRVLFTLSGFGPMVRIADVPRLVRRIWTRLDTVSFIAKYIAETKDTKTPFTLNQFIAFFRSLRIEIITGKTKSPQFILIADSNLFNNVKHWDALRSHLLHLCYASNGLGPGQVQGSMP